MKSQNGKSPLGGIITVVISLLVVGAIVAMVFVENEDISNTIEQYKNNNIGNTVQTQS